MRRPHDRGAAAIARRPSRNPDRYRKSKVLLGATLITLAGGLGAAVALNGGVLAGTPVARNCPDGVEPPVRIDFLIDATDAYSQSQKQTLMDAAVRAARGTPKGGQINVFSMDPAAPWEPKLETSVCSPGRGLGANPIFETPEQMEKVWGAYFLGPVKKAAEQVVTSPPAKTTPLIEAIASLASRPGFKRPVGGVRLIIVSDLLQHSPGRYSHYDRGDPARNYAASPLAAEIEVDLAGAEVEIYYLRRDAEPGLQGRRHKDFWRTWLTDSGAGKVTIYGW